MSVTNTLIAGALAGGFADVLTHPVCTIKARLMAQGAASTAAGEGAAETVVYKGKVFFYFFILIIFTLSPHIVLTYSFLCFY